jgi:hypothetical protein
MFGERFTGLAFTLLFILAAMVFWGFLVRSHVARNPDSPVARGLAFNL